MSIATRRPYPRFSWRIVAMSTTTKDLNATVKAQAEEIVKSGTDIRPRLASAGKRQSSIPRVGTTATNSGATCPSADIQVPSRTER